MASKVTVKILGGRYKISSQDYTDEELLALAEKLDKRMHKTADELRLFDDLQVSVLTALQLSEEYEKLQKDYDELLTLLD